MRESTHTRHLANQRVVAQWRCPRGRLCSVADPPRRLPLEGRLGKRAARSVARFSQPCWYDSLALINWPAPVWVVGVQAQAHPTKRATSKQLTMASTTTPGVIDEDWEEWTPEKGSFLHHMMAGSAAGVAEHVSIFPIDTIKVSNGTTTTASVCLSVCV